MGAVGRSSGRGPDSMLDLYLALDQGGHATRALVFDPSGAIIAGGRETVDTRRPRPGWAEHDPEALVHSCEIAVQRALGELPGGASSITAAGLATQRSSIVCWDRETGAALSPVISWQDRRAHDWLAGFTDRFETIRGATGLYPNAHYGASKLRWCLDRLPEVQEALRDGRLAWGPLASFLTFRLLEERPHLADPANASRTLLWNQEMLDWDPDMLALFDLPPEPLPRSVPSAHPFGTLGTGGDTIPLRLVTGDQPASLFGRGSLRDDVLYINIGTGAFVQRPSQRPLPADSRLLRGVIHRTGDEVTYALEGTVNGADSALRRAESDLGLRPGTAWSSLPGWLAEAGEPPLYLNGVSGLGSPYWVPDFPSRFVGDGEPGARFVAVLESIAFLIQRNVEEMNRTAGPARLLSVSGGLAALEPLCQRLADLAELPVHQQPEAEATARGVAHLLAGRPLGPDSEAGVWFPPAINPALRERYARWHRAMSDAVRDHRTERA